MTKIVNHNLVGGLESPIGVLGLFNCYDHPDGPDEVCGKYGEGDVSTVSGLTFGLYHHGSEKVVVARAGTHLPSRLGRLAWGLATVSPLVDGLAVFGLLDKPNGSRAIEEVLQTPSGGVSVKLLDGGRFGWYAEKQVRSASGCGQPVPVQIRGLLSWVQLPTGGAISLELLVS